jgi:hypothetical protein
MINRSMSMARSTAVVQGIGGAMGTSDLHENAAAVADTDGVSRPRRSILTIEVHHRRLCVHPMGLARRGRHCTTASAGERGLDALAPRISTMRCRCSRASPATGRGVETEAPR